ncbi:MAG: hypothetical protein QOE72_4614, partial [Chloroflexota bacterium]|nr:hypothetical protein [Chloroflexota bacterium]
MSLLDRVQRQQQQETAAAALPGPVPAATRPAAPAAPPVPDPVGGRSALLALTAMQRTALGRPTIQQQYQVLRALIHTRLVEEMIDADNSSHDAVVAKLSELVAEVAAEQSLSLTRQDRQ